MTAETLPLSDYPLMTRKEAAAYLKVKPHTMACWPLTGKGPVYFKLPGGGTRYRKEDLDNYAATRRVDPVDSFDQSIQGDWLSPQQAARYLKIDTLALRMWAVPQHRIAGRTKYYMPDLDPFLDETLRKRLQELTK